MNIFFSRTKHAVTFFFEKMTNELNKLENKTKFIHAVPEIKVS